MGELFRVFASNYQRFRYTQAILIADFIREGEERFEDKLSSQDQNEASSTEFGFPIVGIGASAGGLAAIEEFFASFRTYDNPGMAFVVVQHLAPDHTSILVEILSRYTPMPVLKIEDGMPVRANCVYVIPPNFDIALNHGTLSLLEPTAARGHRLPIDFFFRSLAEDRHHQSIGIILSGSGSDGIQGIKAIKGETGLVIAQLPESAEFDSMPRSAIGTGLVDYQLRPAEMSAQLMAYTSQAFVNRPRQVASFALPAATRQFLNRIFVVLRTTTGHDFSGYKHHTVLRRIERRMAIAQIESIENYVHYLEEHPPEVEALFRDLLIGVTSFFRDPAAFLALDQQVISKIFARDFADKETIRIWSCGCSSGEEAFSIGILLKEHQEATNNKVPIQLFASDIDGRAIATARAAIYPASITADVTPERLARFFRRLPDNQGFQIRKDVREMMVFSQHNVNQDPPFSKLDLLVCRNLLIYFDSKLQKKLMPMFHFALNPEGFLWLGTSEGIGDFDSFFTILDRKGKIFGKKRAKENLQKITLGQFPATTVSSKSSTSRDAGRKNSSVKIPLRDLVEQTLLRDHSPTAALVNADGDILYLHGRAGMFLEPSEGEVRINNILKMARDGLKHELSMALNRVVTYKKTIKSSGIAVKNNGHFIRVDLTVAVARESPSKVDTAGMAELYLVMMQETTNATAIQPVRPIAASTISPASELDSELHSKDAETVIAALKSELRIRDEYVLAAQEELKSTNEELKSSNEEMQSVNEELQSTNEELETSREEMQSINEELSTVNAELNSKIVALTQLNNDMCNLLAGTGIATVFVDMNLRILRFTPTITQLINLITSDIGRPIGHIVSNLSNYNRLAVDAQAVLDTLDSRETQVQTVSGAWFLMRIRPYRTQENVIQGVVITFVDISEAKRIEDELAKANGQLRLAVVVRDSYDAITVQGLDGRIIAWNPSATRIYGWSEAEALELNIRDRIPEAIRESSIKRLYEINREQSIATYNTQRLTKAGATLNICLTVTALVNEHGQTYALATTERLLK